MGRPRKTTKDSRNIKIEVLVNEEEYKLIYEKSLLVNKKLSTYIREHCLDHRIITFGKDISDLCFHLGKMGVNLNQFTKKLNSLKDENLKSADKFLSSAQTTEIDDALKFIDMARKLWITITRAV